MRLLYSSDGAGYRRWVNVALSLTMPGTAQLLAGRRFRGVIILFLFCAYKAFWLAFLLHPKTPGSVLDAGWFDVADLLVAAVIVADSVRFRVKRLDARSWVRFLAAFVGVPLAFALAFRFWVATPYKIPTQAMWPTLKGARKDASGDAIPGDHVWVSRLAYRSRGPARGDMVVFKSKGLPLVQQNTCYVKRVVGLPGETIGINPPYVTVDGQRLIDPPIFRRISGKKGGFCGYVTAGPHPSKTFCLSAESDRVTLGPSEYLVLGDNSTNSFDGRYFGPVQRSAIIGRVISIYAPADRKRRFEASQAAAR